MKLQNKSQIGNWIINLFVLLCNFNIIISKPCRNGRLNVLWAILEVSNKLICALSNKFVLETNTDLPRDWPCEWSDGNIPFVFNFYSVSPRRLISLVRKGHDFLESRSCLKFQEQNPVLMAHKKNTTYLYYTYSGVLENCCLQYYMEPVGRRVVLITPTCTLPAEVAHATLHGLGMVHKKRDPFLEAKAKAVMFCNNCTKYEKKM